MEGNFNEFQEMRQPIQNQVMPQQPQFFILLPFIKSFAGWATFKAVMDIIIGAVSCLGIITAAYGVFQIIAGVKLLGAVDNLKRQANANNSQEVVNALFNLNQYYKFSGIAMIVKISFSILVIVLYIAVIAYIMSHLPDIIRLLPSDSRYF